MTGAGTFLQTTFLKVQVLFDVWCKFSSFLIEREMATSKRRCYQLESLEHRGQLFTSSMMSSSPGSSSRMWGGSRLLQAPNLREDENLSINVRISKGFWATTSVWGERKNPKNWSCFYLKCRHFFQYGFVWITFEFLKCCIDIMYCDNWVFDAS